MNIGHPHHSLIGSREGLMLVNDYPPQATSHFHAAHSQFNDHVPCPSSKHVLECTKRIVMSPTKNGNSFFFSHSLSLSFVLPLSLCLVSTRFFSNNTYIYIHNVKLMYAYIYIYWHIDMYINIHEYMYIFMYVYIYLYISYLPTCLPAYVPTSIRPSIHACIHTYRH